MQPPEVALLDPALWARLSQAQSPDACADAWLTLQCRLVEGTIAGCALLGPANTGPFEPSAAWPNPEAVDAVLLDNARVAITERKGSGQESPKRQVEEQGAVLLAYPFIFSTGLYGAVSLKVVPRPEAELRTAMRQLQWGAAWIEATLHRSTAFAATSQQNRAVTALELLEVVLDQDGFKPSCQALVTELATKLDCDRVSIGFQTGHHCTVEEMSHSAAFGRRLSLAHSLSVAMQEAIDQKTSILYPPPEGGGLTITRAHDELAAQQGADAILTVPLGIDGRTVGAVTFERSAERPFDQTVLDLLDSVLALIAPILDEKRGNDRHIVFKVRDSSHEQIKRLLGPGYLKHKVGAAACLVLVVFFSLAQGGYRVTATARVEGEIQRALVAGLDGYVESEHARAGDRVVEGTVIATLDDRDLRIERLNWEATRQQYLKEQDRALAERNAAESSIAKAQMAQAEAQIALLDSHLERTILVAPFDGLLISGDLSQSVGAAVRRGDVLFEIAPLDRYRVRLEVDQRDLSDVVSGQQGTLTLASLPGQSFPFEVTRITPVSEAKEGQTVFAVEAALEDGTIQLRPGMEGVGKIDVERRSLIWIWTHRLADWLELLLWRWLP